MKRKIVYSNRLAGERCKKAFQSLSEFINIVPESFLTYGSCLASHREQTFISWDTDTDTGILINDFKWSVINTLIQKGFKLTRIYGTPEYGIQFVFYKHVKIDFWVFYEEDNYYYNCLWDKGTPIKHTYPKELLVKDTGILYNKELPSLSKDYLTHVYGNWKVPVKKFNWRTDHKCAEIG